MEFMPTDCGEVPGASSSGGTVGSNTSAGQVSKDLCLERDDDEQQRYVNP